MSYYRSDSQTDHILTKLVTNVISANTSNFTNHSEVTQTHVFDLYEAFRTKESEQLSAYRSVAYVFGVIIFLSNLTVVVSSGLILRKGQQPKSTYLLLGNVSLADTIIGISIIFGASVENTTSSNPLCIFQIGMLVCPAMVSIFSVGMIAVDRYIYILHGLYYQRWFNTTKVRIGILCIWMIGVTLGFMPASGWVNKEMMIDSKCAYVSLFPGMLILLNSLLSIVPIILVAVLYSIILVQALKNVNQINTTRKNVTTKSSNDDPEIRIYRGTKTAAFSVKYVPEGNKTTIKRSASFDTIDVFNKSSKLKAPKDISKSIHNLSSYKEDNEKNKNKMSYANSTNGHLLNLSTCTISTSTILNESISDIRRSPYKIAKAITNCKLRRREKVKEPNKWRAVIIVMLTTGSFVFTWIPFFITVIFYVFCEEKSVNPKCMDLRIMLGGPIAALAFCNSILNPLIYAWWHKGFKRTIKMYFQKYLKRIFKKS